MSKGIVEASHCWPRSFTFRLLLHIPQFLFGVSRDYSMTGEPGNHGFIVTLCYKTLLSAKLLITVVGCLSCRQSKCVGKALVTCLCQSLF